MSGERAVSIVIPARCEGGTIGTAVGAVIESGRRSGVPFDVTVVADSCTDATAARARAALGEGGLGRVLEVDLGNVGAARRVGVSRSMAALRRSHPRLPIWVLSTDADSTVPEDWIATHLRLAAAGAEGVAGLVVVDSFAAHAPSVEAAFCRRYEVGAGGQHRHIHATNLGIDAGAYERVGGWSERATDEEHDLWRRLRADGAALVSTVEAPVRTSGRAHGRAPDGFAGLLRSLGSEDPDGLTR